jgi:hypothetical protein
MKMGIIESKVATASAKKLQNVEFPSMNIQANLG